MIYLSINRVLGDMDTAFYLILNRAQFCVLDNELITAISLPRLNDNLKLLCKYDNCNLPQCQVGNCIYRVFPLRHRQLKIIRGDKDENSTVFNIVNVTLKERRIILELERILL